MISISNVFLPIPFQVFIPTTLCSSFKATSFIIMPSSAQQQSSGNSPIPSDGGGTFPAVVPAGHVNISGVLVRKDGLVVNPGLRALEASPNTVVGQWCPRNDDPTHAILTCTKIHKNALAAAVSTNVASHPSPIVPASPAAISNKPNFPQQPPAAGSSSAASSPTVVDGVTIAVPPHQQQQQQQQQPTITTAGSSANLPTLLTETQRRAAIGAAVSSGGVGGFRRPVGGEKLRKNQIAAQILRAASDTTPLSQSVNTNTNPITTAAAAANVAASQLPPMSPASGGGGGGVGTNTNSSRNNASFGNKDSILESFASGLGGAGTDDSVTRGGSSSKTGTITKAELRGSYQLSNSRSSRGSALHNQEAGHPHQQQRGGNQFHPHYNNQPIHNNNNNSNGGDDGTVVDPRSFQARFPHVVHMCVAHTFNLDDMMSLFKDDLDYEAEMCYDVLHIWREGAGGEGGGSAMKSELEGGDDQEWDVVNRDTSALLGRNNNNNNEDQNDDNNNHHHDPHTTTTTSSKRNKKGPGHHHRSHHRRSGPRLGEGNPRASAVSMRKPFNLFLFAYGSVVFWGSPEVYAEVVEPFISDSVGTGGGSGGQASNLRAGARGTSDYNAPTSRSRKAAHKIISALERAMGQRYPKDVILDRFPVRCSYEIAAFGGGGGGGGGDQYQQQPQYDNPQHGEDLQAHLESYEITSMEPPVTAGEAAAREAEMFKRSLLRNHHFIIPAVSDSIPMLCIAHALAQAAKVDVLEGMINQLMEQCHPLPTQLKDDGFVRITEKHLLQLRGEVLFYRMQLRGGSDLQAEPEPIWHFPAMETFYLITREVFEVEKLIDVLDSKLDAGNEILSVLSDQFSQRHSSRLEWIVIWLVFVEVIIGVLELILDMKPWFM